MCRVYLDTEYPWGAEEGTKRGNFWQVMRLVLVLRVSFYHATRMHSADYAVASRGVAKGGGCEMGDRHPIGDPSNFLIYEIDSFLLTTAQPPYA